MPDNIGPAPMIVTTSTGGGKTKYTISITNIIELTKEQLQSRKAQLEAELTQINRALNG